MEFEGKGTGSANPFLFLYLLVFSFSVFLFYTLVLFYLVSLSFILLYLLFYLVFFIGNYGNLEGAIFIQDKKKKENKNTHISKYERKEKKRLGNIHNRFLHKNFFHA